jgi:hypothetical protein
MKTVLSFFLCLSILELRAADSPLLQLAKTIPLPGVTGRFDHFSIDIKGQRIFLAALGNDTIEVLDVNAGKRIQSIVGCSKPQGVVYLPSLNQFFVANGSDGTLKIFEGTSYRPLKSISSLDDADNVRFDEKANLLYVGYGDGALAVVDPASVRKQGDIKLSGHPESFQLEAQGNRIFVNVPDANEIAVIDRNSKAVIGKWPMARFRGNFPMALDEASHRLFVGCRTPARLVVFDTETGKPVADLEISGDTDDLFYDARRSRVYVSCGEGFVDVIERTSPNTYQRVGKIDTARGARTSFFSSDRDELYVAIPNRASQPAEVRVMKPK